MTQLVERLLLIPEVNSLNPVIGKNYIEHLFTFLLSAVLKKTKINKKRPGMALFIGTRSGLLVKKIRFSQCLVKRIKIYFLQFSVNQVDKIEPFISLHSYSKNCGK